MTGLADSTKSADPPIVDLNMGMVGERVMAMDRRAVAAVLVAAGMAALVSLPAHADQLQTGGTTVTAPDAITSPPGAPAPLVGLQAGGAAGAGALALVPPGSAAAARYDGLAGSSSTSVDLSYVPPAERDSYLNSHDFADHLQTSTRKGHHPSALSQLGGVAEGMAINGALMGLTGLTIDAH